MPAMLFPDGEVYTWGKSARGRLGRKDEETWSPQPVHLEETHPYLVTSVSCCHGNTLLAIKGECVRFWPLCVCSCPQALTTLPVASWFVDSEARMALFPLLYLPPSCNCRAEWETEGPSCSPLLLRVRFPTARWDAQQWSSST